MSRYTDPKIWGPHFWEVMRCVAYNYPNTPTITDKRNIKNFYLDIQNALPCKTCQKNYITHLRVYPIDDGLKNRASLMAWVETIYNETKKIIANKKQEREKRHAPMQPKPAQQQKRAPQTNKRVYSSYIPVQTREILRPGQKKTAIVDPNKLKVRNKGREGRTTTPLPQRSVMFTPINKPKVNPVEKVFSVRSVQSKKNNIATDQIFFKRAEKRVLTRSPSETPPPPPPVNMRKTVTKTLSQGVSRAVPNVNNFATAKRDVRKRMTVIKRCNCGM